MVSNNNGHSPSVKPQLGVGFNRALPAPFGFDNGIKMDGVNDLYIIPLLNTGTFTFPVNWSFEMWLVYNNESYNQYMADFFGAYNTTNVRRLRVFHFQTGRLGIEFNGETAIVGYFNIGLNHIVCSFDGTKGSLYINTVMVSSNNWNTVTPAPPAGLSVSSFSQPPASGYGSTPIKHDELRFYSVGLTPAQVQRNYNSGVGENPFETENLMLWYKYQQFETLDFSALQDGSDMRLGIRDYSSKKYHAAPLNMQTTVGAAGYPFVPF